MNPDPNLIALAGLVIALAVVVVYMAGEVATHRDRRAARRARDRHTELAPADHEHDIERVPRRRPQQRPQRSPAFHERVLAQARAELAEERAINAELEATNAALLAELEAQEWRNRELVADKRAMRSLLDSQTRQHVAVMRLRAETELAEVTEITRERITVHRPVDRPDAIDVELADVIPITSEHRDLVDRLEHRQRLERLRDDASVPIRFWAPAPEPKRRELPPAPEVRLSRQPALEGVA